jgi:hypothetical protein
MSRADLAVKRPARPEPGVTAPIVGPTGSQVTGPGLSVAAAGSADRPAGRLPARAKDHKERIRV